MPHFRFPSRRRSGVPLLAASVAAALVMLTLAVPAVSAPLQAQGTELRVAAGWDGMARTGRLLPVSVTLGGPADGAVALVEVKSVNSGSTVTQVALVEDGATSRAATVVLAPSDGGSFNVRATARRGTDTLATATASVTPATDDQLVGVLPALAQVSPPPATAALTVPVGTARYVEVGLDALDLDGALAPLTTLAASTQDLAALTDGQRTTLLSWLAQGGQLLVDGPGGTVPGLPDAWQPASAGPTVTRVPAALGEVQLTGGRLAAGNWLVEPAPTVSPNDPDLASGSFGGGPVGTSIAREAGLKIPSIGTILGFLVGYVLLAGPITFLILNRLGRAELAWLLVPLLAVGFAVGGFIAGGEARNGSRTAFAASMLETPGTNIGLSFVGVLSRDGGDRTVTFPESWWAGNVANELYGTPEANVRTDRTANGTAATVSLVGGEFAVLGGRGPTATSNGLQLVAGAQGAGAAGTVVNTTSRPLKAVAVFVANRAVRVGDLGPGQQRSYVLTTDPQPADQLFIPVEAQVWPTATGSAPGPDTGPVDLALWGETTRLLGPDVRSPGSALAVGWTDTALPGPDLGAGAEGRSAILSRTPVAPGAVLNGLDVRRDLLRGPNTTPISDAQGPSEGAVFRFVTPPGRLVDPASLRLSIPPTLSRAEVWDGVRWNPVFGEGAPPVAVPGTNPSAPGPQATVPGVPTVDAAPQLVPVGANAVHEGAIYVRVAVAFGGPPNSAAGFVLEQAS